MNFEINVTQDIGCRALLAPASVPSNYFGLCSRSVVANQVPGHCLPIPLALSLLRLSTASGKASARCQSLILHRLVSSHPLLLTLDIEISN